MVDAGKVLTASDEVRSGSSDLILYISNLYVIHPFPPIGSFYKKGKKNIFKISSLKISVLI